jgi:3-oxoacyl-[acyl-carrier protein] reductase
LGEIGVRNLENRVALVTGASRGIGKAIALALAEAGCQVVVNYQKEEAAAQQIAKAIRDMSRGCTVVQADVSRENEVQRLVEEAESAFGQVDILVNNAAISVPKPVAELTLGDWDHTIRVNLTSAFLLTQHVLINMRPRRWGRIINIASVAAQNGGRVGPHYAASKAGLIGLTHSYASLLVKEGITVNAIAPALIETDMVARNPNASPDVIPMGRFGKLDEIGPVAVLLAENGYMTGQTISVNGGWYMT